MIIIINSNVYTDTDIITIILLTSYYYVKLVYIPSMQLWCMIKGHNI